jgi:phosphatidylcholine synthase
VSGVIFGFLALLAVLEGDIVTGFIWLAVALIVDGVDGEMARHANVRAIAPQVDGAILDFVIDYFTYVIVPAVMIYRFGLVPAGWEAPAAAAILAVSCYTFANTRAKTSDYYFSGFPALWNVVVLYFYIIQPDPRINLAVIGICCVLTFVPLKYVHPFRVRRWRALSIGVTALWLAASIRLVLAEPIAISAQAAAPVVFWIWVAASVYFAGISLWRSFRDEPESP